MAIIIVLLTLVWSSILITEWTTKLHIATKYKDNSNTNSQHDNKRKVLEDKNKI